MNLLLNLFFIANNYALIEIYEIVITIILTPLLEKYNDFLKTTKNEMKTTMQSIFKNNYENFLKNSNLNEYKKIK